MALRISQLLVGRGITWVRLTAGNSILDPARVTAVKSVLLKLAYTPCSGLL